MTTTSVERKGVVYPMVAVDVNGVKCRALLDTGAGSLQVRRLAAKG